MSIIICEECGDYSIDTDMEEGFQLKGLIVCENCYQDALDHE